MDFLKSAVASAIAKGPPFPYSFGDKVDVDQSIWTLYNGTRRVGARYSSSPPVTTLTCHRKTGLPVASFPSTFLRTRLGFR